MGWLPWIVVIHLALFSILQFIYIWVFVYCIFIFFYLCIHISCNRLMISMSVCIVLNEECGATSCSRMWSDEITVTSRSLSEASVCLCCLLFPLLLDNKHKTHLKTATASRKDWKKKKKTLSVWLDGPPSLKRGCQDSSPAWLSFSFDTFAPPCHFLACHGESAKHHRASFWWRHARKSRQPDACQNQLCLSKTPANTLAGVTLVIPALPFYTRL